MCFKVNSFSHIFNISNVLLTLIVAKELLDLQKFLLYKKSTYCKSYQLSKHSQLKCFNFTSKLLVNNQ